MTLHFLDNGAKKSPSFVYVLDGGVKKTVAKAYRLIDGVKELVFCPDAIPVYGDVTIYDNLESATADNPIIYDPDDTHLVDDSGLVNNIRRDCFSIWFIYSQGSPRYIKGISYAEVSYDLSTVTYPNGGIDQVIYSCADVPGCTNRAVGELNVLEYNNKFLMIHTIGESDGYSWGDIGIADAPLDQPMNFTYRSLLLDTPCANGNPQLFLDFDNTLYFTVAPYNICDRSNPHEVRLFRIDDYLNGVVTDLGQIYPNGRSGFTIQRLPEDNTYYYATYSDHEMALYLARRPIADGPGGTWEYVKQIKSGIWQNRSFAYHDHTWYMASCCELSVCKRGDWRDIAFFKTPKLG